jgi:hypothetical protein
MERKSPAKVVIEAPSQRVATAAGSSYDGFGSVDA